MYSNDYYIDINLNKYMYYMNITTKAGLHNFFVTPRGPVEDTGLLVGLENVMSSQWTELYHTAGK
jgi:hypothetical protein